MKTNFIKLFALSSVLWLSSCNDEFFDRKPYDSLPVGDAIKTENDMSVAVNGVYARLRSATLYGRTIPFIGDLMADNVYLSASNSGRYITQNNYSVIPANADLTSTWTDAYSAILRANNVINASVTETAGTKQLKGEALTVRALMYFELVKIFAKPYTSDAAALGVPIVTTFDPTLKPKRNSVGEVYDQIIKDLTQAFDLMTITNKNSSYVSKYVAKAALAKVYLYKGDYANALTAATDVIKNGGYSLSASTGLNAYWANPAPVTTKLETIFEVSSDGVANNGFDALVNMYSQDGYGDGICTTDLYALYSDTDARKALLIKGTRAAESVWIVNKYQNIKNNNDKDDAKVLRYADILLIAAEAAYRTNDETNAQGYLNQVAQRRDPALKPIATTGAILLEDIITERRKELAFEGDRYFDLTRLLRDVKRNTQYPTTARTIAITDSRRIAPIPQVELDANTNMVQNSGY